MKYPIIVSLFFSLFLMSGCSSDDDSEPRPVVTSFSGTVLFEPTMEPVNSANLFIVGRDSRGITGSIVRADTILRIDDGTFEVSFETIEEVDRFSIAIEIIQNEQVINTFVAGSDPPLSCLPGDCERFPPGQDYELNILVPCDPNDCILFPPPN